MLQNNMIRIKKVEKKKISSYTQYDAQTMDNEYDAYSSFRQTVFFSLHTYIGNKYVYWHL